jgi:hypothetical protein
VKKSSLFKGNHADDKERMNDEHKQETGRIDTKAVAGVAISSLARNSRDIAPLDTNRR